MDRRRNGVVTALAHVDMIVGADRLPTAARGQGGDNLVGVHVGACAGASLDGTAERLIKQAQFHVDFGRTLFD